MFTLLCVYLCNKYCVVLSKHIGFIYADLYHYDTNVFVIM